MPTVVATWLIRQSSYLRVQSRQFTPSFMLQCILEVQWHYFPDNTINWNVELIFLHFHVKTRRWEQWPGKNVKTKRSWSAKTVHPVKFCNQSLAGHTGIVVGDWWRQAHVRWHHKCPGDRWVEVCPYGIHVCCYNNKHRSIPPTILKYLLLVHTHGWACNTTSPLLFYQFYVIYTYLWSIFASIHPFGRSDGRALVHYRPRRWVTDCIAK
jgi:hypothetical protein